MNASLITYSDVVRIANRSYADSLIAAAWLKPNAIKLGQITYRAITSPTAQKAFVYSTAASILLGMELRKHTDKFIKAERKFARQFNPEVFEVLDGITNFVQSFFSTIAESIDREVQACLKPELPIAWREVENMSELVLLDPPEALTTPSFASDRPTAHEIDIVSEAFQKLDIEPNPEALAQLYSEAQDEGAALPVEQEYGMDDPFNESIRAELASKTVKQLRSLAKKRGHTQVTQLKRHELMNLLA